MRGLRTSELLVQLSEYSFYDWERTFDSRPYYAAWFGMPQSVLDDLKVPTFYDTWGFDAVQNPHATPSFTVEQWLQFEETFFSWLRPAQELLLDHGTCIVTPNLMDWWYPLDQHPIKWGRRNRWMKPHYERYVGLVDQVQPFQESACRGGIIEGWTEFETLSRMATRNKRLQFFTGGDRVVTITEYLTVIIDFSDQQVYQKVADQMHEQLRAQLLQVVTQVDD
jgi:hypothetical protein